MTSIKYRPDLQGLRAIAVLMVILKHAGYSFFSGGFIGVDVFFVLSGYLISGLLINEYQSNGNIQFLVFISRRLKRLLPALALVLSVTLLLSPFLISSHELDQQLKSAFFAATWTSNLFFAFSKLDYFSELQTRDFFLHTWSLGVEEQFYIVWPLLLTLLFGWLSKQQGMEKPDNRLLWFFCFLFVSSLSLCVFWSNNHPLWAFYLMPSRIWQFSLGASIFVWEEKLTRNTSEANRELLNSSFKCFGVLGLGLIIGSGGLLKEKMTYPSFWALVPSIGAALAIAAGANNTNNLTYRLLSNPVLVWLGNRSYSWYLWHWPILMFGFAWGAQNYLIAVFILSLRGGRLAPPVSTCCGEGT
jgi:peptidoglycan/LPS O-acetylase OafA/YrhL